MPGRDQGGHVPGGPQLASAAPHRVFAAPLPAVPVVEGHARQGGDFPCTGTGQAISAESRPPGRRFPPGWRGPVRAAGRSVRRPGPAPRRGWSAAVWLGLARGRGLAAARRCPGPVGPLAFPTAPGGHQSAGGRHLGGHQFRRHLLPPVALLGLHGDELPAPGTRARNSRKAASGNGRTGGRRMAPNWASVAASRASVLASRPVARANCRTWRGLTTTAGSPAAANSDTRAGFQSPGGLYDDPLRLQRDQLRHQLAQAGSGVLHTPGPVCRKRPTIQARFGHVNANACHCPSGHDVLHPRIFGLT